MFFLLPAVLFIYLDCLGVRYNGTECTFLVVLKEEKKQKDSNINFVIFG